ncbi:hypothetical protein K501DRAFT_242550 [Backusella circina FSU 941]|nr:hypothetical protein K501DRAFT_242550 [Backusella circina FSU 941]
MSLEIYLLPEFGWSIKGQHVFGPGSVFQGFIKLNLSPDLAEKADKVRIVFHANESVYTIARSKPLYNKQLFGSQRVILKRKTENDFDAAAQEIARPFIIQLPMVNFPPSSNIVSEAEGISYHTNFNLTAYLDQADGTNLLQSKKPILYMPLIETSALKNPMTFNIADNNNDENPITVKLTSLDYVPGDKISVLLSVNNNSSSSKKNIESITLKLYHIQTWSSQVSLSKGKINTKKLVASSSTSKINMSHFNDHGIESLLEIPLDAIPSFNYSPQFTSAYQILISIKQRGVIWSHGTELATIPIHIGTLGYGIHSPEKIKDYTAFRGVFDNPSELPALPVPQFLNQLEYEEALPVYEEQTVPPYQLAVV